jgi:hypothetical protein
MKRILIITLLACLFTAASAQKPTLHKALASRHAETVRGNNPNIKVAKPTADMEAKKPEKVRGGCDITFNNKTGFYIDIYVDGTYKSTLGPYESTDVNYTSSYSSVYCITVGGKYDWSAAGECESHIYFDLY